MIQRYISSRYHVPPEKKKGKQPTVSCGHPVTLATTSPRLGCSCWPCFSIFPPLPACRSVCDPLYPSHSLSLARRLPPSVNPSRPVFDMASLGEDLLSTVNKLQDLVFNTIGNDSLDLPQIVSLPAYGQRVQVNRLIW